MDICIIMFHEIITGLQSNLWTTSIVLQVHDSVIQAKLICIKTFKDKNCMGAQNPQNFSGGCMTQVIIEDNICLGYWMTMTKHHDTMVYIVVYWVW